MKNKLQKLLDEKFPSNGDIYNDSQMMAMRAIFTEGYNAAKEEYANPTENRTINIERLLNNYAAMIKGGPKVDAPLTSEGICQVLGRDPGIWSARIVYAINNTYGAGINPTAIPELYAVLKAIVDYDGEVKEHSTFNIPYSLMNFALTAIEKAKL